MYRLQMMIYISFEFGLACVALDTPNANAALWCMELLIWA